jgi:CRP-like cAMP-binding protein
VPQLTKFARQALDQVYTAIDEIAALRKEAVDEALDQKMVKLLMAKIENTEARLRRHIANEIEPLLERQAPQYDKRLAQLEEQVKILMDMYAIEVQPDRQRVKS